MARNHFLYFFSYGLVVLFIESITNTSTAGTRTDCTETSDWQQITSADQVWKAYPGRIRSLLGALNLDYTGLEAVRSAVQAKDTLAACNALLAYYRRVGSLDWLYPNVNTEVEADVISMARQLSGDTVTFSGVTARVPRRDHGGWEWRYTGPENDHEFGYSLNGHQYLLSLLEAWKVTNNDTYLKIFDRLIRDWIIHNPLPEKGDSIYVVLNSRDNKLDWRDIGEVRWRDLEAGNRLGVSWPQTFYGFQRSDAFTPAARLLMLASISEQAVYLMVYHKEGHNWTTMEMNGLALTGLAFPEFNEAQKWATYALDVMKKEIYRQVYPDGVQKELSTKTQWVALRRFESVADNFRKAGREIPDNYIARLEEMYNYMAYVMRPDGHQPLNNDSDREDLRPRVMQAAKTFGRPDWEWIATNGKKGIQPEGLPSVVFPWAGIHVMRSGWDNQAQWAFFDSGPFGTGHQHADKLHLSVAAYGRDLLVDGGRYTHENYWSFDPKIWRGYFRSSFSHNVILIDGKGQNGGVLTTEKPLQEGVSYLNTPDFDYASGTFSGGYSGAEGYTETIRSVLYVRNKFWVVVDRVLTDQPRTVQALWHFAPACTVVLEQKTAVSTNPGEGNLRIVPVGKIPWRVELVKGQTNPTIQGWYSSDYGSKKPNSTTVYTALNQKSTTFAWVLVPAKGVVPSVSANFISEDEKEVRVRVHGADGKPLEITVPLLGGVPGIK